MSITLSNLKAKKGVKRSVKRAGRGNACGKGNYSGRGMKGQRSRSGGKSGLKIKGLKMTLHRVPKLPGFTSLRKKPAIVNLRDLEKKFNDNDLVSRETLIQAGLVDKNNRQVKILSKGELTKKLEIEITNISKQAIEAIKKAGGSLKNK